MKVYLAAQYSRREELQRAARDLASIGHEISSTWIREENELLDDAFRTLAETNEIAARLALINFHEICKAECFVALTEEPFKATIGGGRHVELGMAIALMFAEPQIKRRVMLVGPPENLFCHMDVVERFQYWPDALMAIGAAPIVARGGGR